MLHFGIASHFIVMISSESIVSWNNALKYLVSTFLDEDVMCRRLLSGGLYPSKEPARRFLWPTSFVS